ncbi:MAG: flagellar FliJ family protein [Polyangiaceae bacterium]|nr:flagellar FliJ family protein [Polyangiaceae bacterium]
MTSRRKRLDKVVKHRERQLENKVQALQQSRNAQAAAAERAHQERQMLRQAAEYREALTRQVVQVADLAAASQWVEARTGHLQHAHHQLARADAVVERAQQSTLAARNELKRVELLDSRLARFELKQNEGEERKAQDEHCARQVVAKRRSSADPP